MAVRDRVLAEAAGAPIPTARQAFPRHAAQAVSRLALPSGGIVATTLDLSLQVALERMAADHLATLAAAGFGGVAGG